MRLDEVRRLEKIPLLGSAGKTDYRQLRALLLEAVQDPAGACCNPVLPEGEATS